MTVLYARTDVSQVTIAGTGHSHKRKGNERLAVNCAACEPELRRMGFHQDPRMVELTPDEMLAAKTAQQEIARFETAKIAADAKEAAAAVRAAGSAAVKRK